MLKLLHEEDATGFQETLNALLNDNSVEVGPTFRQQTRFGRSIPDLVIDQRRFTVRFEVKLSDWFTRPQIANHINAMPDVVGDDTSVLVLLSPEEIRPEERFTEEAEAAATRGVQVTSTTFQKLLESIQSNATSTSGAFNSLLPEFEEFLNGEGLIPKWQRILDVVNNGQKIDEIDNFGIYCCPDTGGHYSHARARYLGAYKDKTVSRVSEIEGVVIVSLDENQRLTTEIKHSSPFTEPSASANLKQRAMDFIEANADRRAELKDYDLQVFVLSEVEETDFRKDTPGGMFGSKQYFRDIPTEVSNAKELANFLRGREWSKWNLQSS
ncbi:hypothetical protein [Flaviflexus massiliensis]|uniref:hypothetical protein n=1 Tax=Flaviflexus massiliensis TaxID=1522309 RepID=UPI001C9CC6C8|nr:hypothetical protein [Flaviflexus massiliensis]